MLETLDRELAEPAFVSSADADVEALCQRFLDRTASVAIIGMGYVGLPLAKAIADAGLSVIGIDIDAERVAMLNEGRSYIRHIAADVIGGMVASQRFRATTDFGAVARADAILISVPTPLSRNREPDLTFVVETTRSIAPHLRKGHLIVLESTTYPGTTSEVLRPILEETGLRSGRDFFLAYSPEREDPGNADFTTTDIPKVVGGDGASAMKLATALYGQIIGRVVPVSSSAAAEAVKLTENIFRAVNIALVNELKVVYHEMGIDIWEIIEAAKTKPFGFMAFYPGPGLGGHCIPIDPFYLTWKAREYGIFTRFIELAGEINTAMPRYVIGRLADELDARARRGLNGASVLVVGLAYKKNVDDMRESPSLRLIELLEQRGAHVAFYDPLIPVIPRTREHADLADRRSIEWSVSNLAAYDAVLIATDHDNVDYAALVDNARLVMDTRNVCARHGIASPNLVKC